QALDKELEQSEKQQAAQEKENQATNQQDGQQNQEQQQQEQNLESQKSTPSESCPDNTCRSKEGCTCDPCKKVRTDISNKEKENFKASYLGTKIKIKDLNGKEKDVTTSIRDEQRKSYRETRLIKEELSKLENAERFMIQCPLISLQNVGEFLNSKDKFESQGWIYLGSDFWRNIILRDDWAGFYCPVSGTDVKGAQEETSSFEQKNVKLLAALPTDLPLDMPRELRKAITSPTANAPQACSADIPVGEIFDRTSRVGYKLVERLEKLSSLGEELAKAVDDLHVLVSQCSSRGKSSNPERGGCRSICWKKLGKCIKYCEGSPCPDGAIQAKLKEISEIVNGSSESSGKKQKEGTKDVVEQSIKTEEKDKEDSASREQVGIQPIIKQVVPKILEDLQVDVRDRMKFCVSTASKGNQAVNCQNVTNQIGPEGRIIKNCCYSEIWFIECEQQCYLEAGDKNYKACTYKCLDKQAKKYNIEDMKYCRQMVNFFCCAL
ncbi:MAG: hypothetical protein PHP03_03970, partial [Candidatus Pacebacteria bacterium]|nr:hypothetical protein [Candidatus Paceibacterota bacterium]